MLIWIESDCCCAPPPALSNRCQLSPQPQLVAQDTYRLLWILSSHVLPSLPPLEAGWTLPPRNADHLMLDSAMEGDAHRQEELFPELYVGRRDKAKRAAAAAVSGKEGNGEDSDGAVPWHYSEDGVQLVRPQAAWSGRRPSVEDSLRQANAPEPLLPLRYGVAHHLMVHHLSRISKPQGVMNFQVFDCTQPLNDDPVAVGSILDIGRRIAMRASAETLPGVNHFPSSFVSGRPTPANSGGSGGSPTREASAASVAPPPPAPPARTRSEAKPMTNGPINHSALPSGHAPVPAPPPAHNGNGHAHGRQPSANAPGVHPVSGHAPAHDELQTFQAMYPPLVFESRFESGNLRAAFQVCQRSACTVFNITYCRPANSRRYALCTASLFFCLCGPRFRAMVMHGKCALS